MFGKDILLNVSPSFVYPSFYEEGQKVLDSFLISEEPILWIMIVGGHKTGKTSTLHSWGVYCGYDCVRVLSPGKMVGMDPSKKMSLMFKIFSEGNSSKKSVIIVDDLDIILEYTEYGCRV